MTQDGETALGLDATGLLTLMTWLSPAFPVGAYSYSHGIEQAVESGLLHNREDVTAWVGAIVERGGGWVDGVLFLEAHRAVLAGAKDRLTEVAALAAAWRSTAETALESQAQGKAFLLALAAVRPSLPLAGWCEGIAPPTYAIAVAIAAALAGIDEAAALPAFLHAMANNLVSAAVRLVPLGQTDGQRAVDALAGRICAIADRARTATLDDLGTAVPMIDWTSMCHETQYTRLFRS